MNPTIPEHIIEDALRAAFVRKGSLLPISASQRCMLTHFATRDMDGPLRPSTQIADAALQPVEADPDRGRSILGGSMTAERNKARIRCELRERLLLRTHHIFPLEQFPFR